MSVIRKAALDALATALHTAVPALTAVHATTGEPEDTATFPALALLARHFRFQPAQAREVDTTDPDPDDPADTTPSGVVEEVGCFTGTVELRLHALTPAQREACQEAIVNALLVREGAPGVLMVQTPAVTVGGVVTLYSAPCAVTLEDDEWHEEMVFEHRRFTYLDLELSYPALVHRAAPTIDEIHLCLTHDLEATEPVIVDEVVVTEEGA